MVANSPRVAKTHGPILVVDDDPGIRDLLTIALGRAGYETVVAESA